MPLQDLKWRNKDANVILWRITENEEELSQMYGVDECPSGITHSQKRKEWLVSRLLIKQLAHTEGLNYKGVGKKSNGQPFLKGHSHHISISHSFPYVVAQIHSFRLVGIDIEQPKSKLLKVTPRVLSLTEMKNAGGHITKLCIYWCAKEALYKIYNKRGIFFSTHLTINPFDLLQEGDLTGSIIRLDNPPLICYLHYVVHTHFVIVYSN